MFLSTIKMITLLEEKESNMSYERKYTTCAEDDPTGTQSFLNLDELKSHSGSDLLKFDSTFC
jgi:hypothetical protein